MSSNEAGRIGGEKHTSACKLIEFSKPLHGRAHQKFPATLSAVEQGDI